MDSPDTPTVPPIIDDSATAPPQPEISIVRDGILSFIVSVSLTLLLVAFIVVAGILSGNMPVNPPEGFSITPSMMIPLLVVAELPFAAVGLVLRWMYRRSGRLLPSLGAPQFSAVMKGIGAGLAMSAFGFLHAALASTLFGRASTEAMEELMRSLLSLQGNPATVATLVLSIAVLAPLCEEFFFRGAIFSSVRSTQKAWAGAIVSSVLFAVAHGNPMMFTYYLVFALAMCWLLSKTGTIATPIAAHMTVNTIACVAVLLSGSVE